MQEKEKEIMRLKNEYGTGSTLSPLGLGSAKRPTTSGAREDPFRQELEYV